MLSNPGEETRKEGACRCPLPLFFFFRLVPVCYRRDACETIGHDLLSRALLLELMVPKARLACERCRTHSSERSHREMLFFLSPAPATNLVALHCNIIIWCHFALRRSEVACQRIPVTQHYVSCAAPGTCTNTPGSLIMACM